MNTNDYTPKFKKSKKTGYYNETPKRLLKKNSAVNANATATANANSNANSNATANANSNSKVSVKKNIKKAISSAIEYVKGFKRKSKKDVNNDDELQSKITKLEDNNLEILESEMIKMVENVKNVENEEITDSNVMNKFRDIINNLTIELHHAIGYTEQTNAKEKSIEIVLHKEAEQPKEVEHSEEIQQTDKNLIELNSILNFLADNILDDKKNKKELSFSELTTSETSTYTIRVISLGIAISYTTLEEFIEKIANRAGTVKSLCWFAGCPEQFKIELKKFIDLNNATQKDYDKIFKIFKNMIDAYLSKVNPEIHSKIVQIINLTGGGKRRKPKKATTNTRKPKKATTNTRKPKKATLAYKKI